MADALGIDDVDLPMYSSESRVLARRRGAAAGIVPAGTREVATGTGLAGGRSRRENRIMEGVITITVTEADCDELGHLNHVEAVRYLERARGQWYRECGFFDRVSKY